MTFLQFLVGAVALTILVAAYTLAGIAVRRRFAPELEGAHAALFAAVTGTTALLAASMALGVVGLFSAWSTFGVGLLVLIGASRSIATQPPRFTVPTFSDLGLVASMAGAVVAVLALANLNLRLDSGISNPDSLSYHLPLASRMLDTHSILDTGPIWQDPASTFYPAASEVLHTIGLQAFGGHEFLSVVLNIPWIGLALLAGWCLGAQFGAGRQALLAVLVLLASQSLVETQIGEAKNDIAGIALVLASVALLTNGRGKAPSLLLAVACASLAAGTRYALLPIGALLVIICAFELRRASARVLAGGLAACALGAVWYVRNWIVTGNPIAPGELGAGPIDFSGPASAIADATAPTVAEVADFDLWRSTFVPGLESSFGPLWFVTVLLAAAGVLACLLTPERRVRMIAIVAAGAGIAYLVTPSGAGPDARLFEFNLRYAYPAIALALICAVVALARRDVNSRIVEVGLAALVVSASWSSWALFDASMIMKAGILAASAGIVWFFLARLKPRRQTIALAGVVAGVVLVLGVAASRFEANRYSSSIPFTSPEQSSVYTWARDVTDSRIAFAGGIEHFPLFGPDNSNGVLPLGSQSDDGSFRSPSTCDELREDIAGPQLDYLVIIPRFPFDMRPVDEIELVEDLPDARSLLMADEGAYAVYDVSSVGLDSVCDAGEASSIGS